jgi:hypothetical protein
MFLKSSFAALAAAIAIAAPSAAEARTRLHIGFFAPYYYSPAPEFYYPGPGYDEFDDDAYEPDLAYGYEPDYYEPEPAPPRKAKPLVKKPAAKKPQPAPKTAAKKPVVPAATLISCSKATGIVAGYGFSDVKASDCKGQSYAFNATRDGKPYVIKLSAKSGELTDVAKQ